MLTLNSFDYHLPEDLIAQYPAGKRRLSRLLVLDRRRRTIEHKNFTDFISYLSGKDTLALNNTYVIPARLNAIRKSTGAKLEVFITRKTAPYKYQVLIKPSKRAKEGEIIVLKKSGLEARVIKDNSPMKLIEFEKNADIEVKLEEEGAVPLPPYIKRQPDKADKSRYQTVFARHKGAVAAPTAGLHFDKPYLKEIECKGTAICYLTLHVSYGTFKPITREELDEGRLHSEWYRIPPKTASRLNKTASSGGRVIAVGTTVSRALESAVLNSRLHPVESETDIFIYPPYKFKFTDALLTNFHLPRSSLLMLVSAFVSSEKTMNIKEGHSFLMKAYEEAVRQKYRFYSYGDAMLII